MRRDRLTGLAVGAGLALAALLTSGTAAALDPTIPAPVTRLSSDGRTATDGQRTLSASVVAGLDSGGQRIEVSGSGYDTFKGIYVAFCVVPPTNQTPTPCGGGADISGTSGASTWISSNPPPQGVGVAEAYGPGGSFRVSIAVSPTIGPPGGTPIDCRRARCALVTRNDHTRSTDRGQDIFVPVSFATASTATTPPTTTPATTAPPTSMVALPEPTAPASVDPTTTTTVEQTTDTDPTEVAGAPIADTASGSSSPAGLLVLVLGAAALVAAVVVSLVVRGATEHRTVIATDRTMPIVRIVTVVLLVVVVAAALTGCATGGSEPTAAVGASATEPAEPVLPVTVASADGREVTVTDASRLIPLAGSISETLFALGLGDRVVARDISATFPEAADLPLVTRSHDVSPEALLSLEPTLVLAQTDTGPPEALDQIRLAGVPVLVLDQLGGLDDLPARVRAIASAVGLPDAGEDLIRRTDEGIARAQQSIPTDGTSPKVAFLYLRGQAGVYLIGGRGSGADSMIEAAGANDAGTALGLDRPFTSLTSEALVGAAPDVILMTTTGLESVGGIDGLLQIPGIAETPAGRDRRIVTEEDGLLYSFGPRTPTALADLIAELYATPSATS